MVIGLKHAYKSTVAGVGTEGISAFNVGILFLEPFSAFGTLDKTVEGDVVAVPFGRELQGGRIDDSSIGLDAPPMSLFSPDWANVVTANESQGKIGDNGGFGQCFALATIQFVIGQWMLRFGVEGNILLYSPIRVNIKMLPPAIRGLLFRLSLR